MADSIQKDVVTSAEVHQAGDQTFSRQTGLSVSRQVKIGVVLLLTFGGYFLMEDRPQPTAIDSTSVAPAAASTSQMQEFVDELQFIEPNDAGKYSPPATGLRLPAQASSPDVATGEQHQEFNAMLNGTPETQSAHKPAVYQRTPVTVSESRHMTIRFTGRIEPLR